MERLYKTLKIAFFVFLGIFIGGSLYIVYDYNAHPGLYALRSAPWYLDILINGIFTAVVLIAITVIMLILIRKMILRVNYFIYYRLYIYYQLCIFNKILLTF